MPPKQIYVEPASSRSRAPKGVFASTYEALTSAENASVVRSVGIFGVRFLTPLSVTQSLACKA